MAERKTQPNDADVNTFLDSVHNTSKAEDARKLLTWMEEASGSPPRMWGTSIVGFGTYEGKTGEWMRIGFSPRKRELVAYLMPGFDGSQELLGKLGKHKTGASCLYIKRLSDIDEDVLKQLIAGALAQMDATYGPQT
ncbi:MAG: DUF1801 domain-containing protein [Proteobacteria bacterium]|nr:DUF1801 domain-containing protein [Pseudomonadota bacterium]